MSLGAAEYYGGIDVGASGGYAIFNTYGHIVTKKFTSFKEASEDFKSIGNKGFVVLEQVSAMPGQGVKSMFSFGSNYGGWQALLEILQIPYQLVIPRKWQAAILGSFPKGESKVRALSFCQKRFPHLNLKKKDDGICDALCIALYAKHLSTMRENINITT